MQTLTVIVCLPEGAKSVKVPFISSEAYSIYKAFDIYPEAKEIVAL